MSRLIRAISEDGGVVLWAVDSTGIVAKAEEYHETSAVTSAALGRLLTAAAIMGVMLKDPEDSLTLRLRGDGPAGDVVAVASGKGTVKGYVANPVVEIPLRPDGKLDVGGAVGHNGVLIVAKDIGMREPYIGQIPLVSGEVAEDISSYYATSEQIPNVCALGVLVDKDLKISKAGGYMLQLLPGTTDETISQLEKNVAVMPSVTSLLQDGKTLEDIMEMSMQGLHPNILDEQEVTYACNCSEKKVKDILLSLGADTLDEMMAEGPDAEVCCQFCNKKYSVPIAPILQKAKEKRKMKKLKIIVDKLI